MSDEIAGNLSDADPPKERCSLIRKIEEALGAASQAGNLPGPVHLYVGQRAVAVGVCAPPQIATGSPAPHRGRGRFIAKGGVAKQLVAEVFGGENGIRKGRGGSMLVGGFRRGIIGANGTVGGGIGLTMAAALAARLDRDGASVALRSRCNRNSLQRLKRFPAWALSGPA
jgi:pyruvate dehydrogenase E1 component alpha subunit